MSCSVAMDTHSAPYSQFCATEQSLLRLETSADAKNRHCCKLRDFGDVTGHVVPAFPSGDPVMYVAIVTESVSSFICKAKCLDLQVKLLAFRTVEPDTAMLLLQ